VTACDAPIALTGGSGFVGRRFADRARSRGFRIRHLARRPDVASPGDDYRRLDLTEEAVDPAILDGCDRVVHLAAHIPRNHTDPSEAGRSWRINALGTLHLAEAAATAGISRFIQTTSANAYAAWEAEPSETAAMFPRSRGYYLGAKMIQEIYADEVCRRAGMTLVTLRLASVYGLGQTTGAIAAIVAKAVAGMPVTLEDGGRFGADFVHVDDVVTALMLTIENESAGPFNVGSGVCTTIAEVGRLCMVLTEQDPALIHLKPESDEGDLGFPALSIGRMRALGYAPRDLSTGLAEMIRDLSIEASQNA
jgi:UDP-glucose 4-epimerase